MAGSWDIEAIKTQLNRQQEDTCLHVRHCPDSKKGERDSVHVATYLQKDKSVVSKIPAIDSAWDIPNRDHETEKQSNDIQFEMKSAHPASKQGAAVCCPMSLTHILSPRGACLTFGPISFCIFLSALAA